MEKTFSIPPRPPSPSIYWLLDAPLRWLGNLTALPPLPPNSRLQDLENQYRKEKEEADLLLEQQRLVRGWQGRVGKARVVGRGVQTGGWEVGWQHFSLTPTESQ